MEAKSLIVLVSIAAMLVIGVSAVGAQYHGLDEQTDSVDDQAWTVQTDEWVQLVDQPDATATDEAIVNHTGSEMSPGLDYEWDENGSVRAVADGDLENDTIATASYQLTAKPAQATTHANSLLSIYQIGSLGAVIMAVVGLAGAAGRFNNVRA